MRELDCVPLCMCYKFNRTTLTPPERCFGELPADWVLVERSSPGLASSAHPDAHPTNSQSVEHPCTLSCTRCTLPSTHRTRARSSWVGGDRKLDPPLARTRWRAGRAGTERTVLLDGHRGTRDRERVLTVFAVRSGPRCSEEDEEVGRQHQRQARARHQVGQVLARVQVDPQGDALGQG